MASLGGSWVGLLRVCNSHGGSASGRASEARGCPFAGRDRHGGPLRTEQCFCRLLPALHALATPEAVLGECLDLGSSGSRACNGRRPMSDGSRLDLVTPPVAARLGPRSGRVGRGARVPHLNIADWHRAVGDRKLDGGRAVTRVSEQWHRTLRSSARMLPCVVARAAPRSRQRQSGGSGQRKKFVDGTREEQDEHFGASQKPERQSAAAAP